jgi:hypothetical protein
MDDASSSLKLIAPLKIELQAAQVAINATQLNLQSPGGIVLQTTGSTSASLVIIDGKPFGVHVHMPPVIPPAGTTGPVAP